MDNIEHDHPNDCESCCSKMFSEWLDINPAAAWEDITTAVDNLLSNGMLKMSYLIFKSLKWSNGHLLFVIIWRRWGWNINM